MIKMKLFFSSIIILFFTNLWSSNTVPTIADGPYVNYRDKQIVVTTIYHDGNGKKYVGADSFAVSSKKSIELLVPTDEAGKKFVVKFKSKLENEKAEYNKVKKQFIVSDIEANFKAFRTLLQANGVIDENLDWTFGEGHLVLTGDFFDRGNQLNEVLWLIYSLEDKANAAKGYVHFILGNHEVMNLNADLRYVHPKYHENAQLMNRTYLSLFGDDTELGRWLRTKNIIERVGDMLCMHGGVSRYLNIMGLSLTEINGLARPYYADTSYNYPNVQTEIMFSDQGPLWYRGYYAGPANERATQGQVDSSLQLFRAKFIATGHTIVAHTVGLYFNGKVFNTDVPHAQGISEAILIEDNKFFKVNLKGERKEMVVEKS